jgi:hypothetical protein
MVGVEKTITLSRPTCSGSTRILMLVYLLSICMSSYAPLNPPTPVPPLNLKGPSDLCPGPKKTLQSIPGLLLI